MNFLLDVNALVAWGWADHGDHDRVAIWIAGRKSDRKCRLLTSPIPQIGFVRVSVQRAGGVIAVGEAGVVLAGMIASLGGCHQFLPDDQPSDGWPAWCQGAARTTDAHLKSLADRHNCLLATLDGAIPGAFLIPENP